MDRARIVETIDQVGALCAELPRVRIMEICGTHTVSLFRTGVKDLLADRVELISGPGCPVCVTSQGYIDAACELAARDDVTICTYGDMVRVPGSTGSLGEMRAKGAEVMVVYSAADALAHAIATPQRKVVFLAVGFETTTPPTALTVLDAAKRDTDNFFILPAHKLVIPALDAVLSAGEVPIDGFLCPGHVSIIIGADAYKPIAEGYGKPCVVAGFEPQQMADGVLSIVRQIAEGVSRVDNVYSTAVSDEGNTAARKIIDAVFVPADAVWRAMGGIPNSGLALREPYARFDAFKHFDVVEGPDVCPPGCLCGDVIQGKAHPPSCPQFGKTCTPARPIGPCMVSSEGACAAWYKYGKPVRNA